MRVDVGRRPGFFLLLVIPLLWMGCSSRPGQANVVPATRVVAALLPSATAGATATRTLAPPATLTAVPTVTSTPEPTATATPSPQPTLTPTNTPLPSATPPDRTCPDPAPEKPDYRRYVLGIGPWPTPDPAGFEPHFWLSTPVVLEEDERLRTNPGYPYGSDGSERYLLHNGLDISGSLGTQLLAPADGTVVVAQDDYTELYGWRCDWYGHLLVIELDEKWQGRPVYVLYGHVLNFLVEVGERVERGQPVVEVGVGGAATVPHLHMEVRVGGNEFGMTRNPLLWLAPDAERGVLAGRLVDPAGRPWQGVLVTAAGPAYASTWTYLGDARNLINPDEQLGENFVIGDLPAGRYRVIVSLQGEAYSTYVDVAAGGVSFVEVVTQPYKTPTPFPSFTPTPGETPVLTATPTVEGGG